MKQAHLTLRLPAALARLLDRRARERDLPRSQVVREAVSEYLAPASAPSGAMASVSGRDLAQVWPSLPHLGEADARRVGGEIETARHKLLPVDEPWA